MIDLTTITVAISVLIIAIPIGFILRKMTPEELKDGKIYFAIIWLLSLILALISFFLNFSEADKYTIIFSLIFIAIISFISWFDIEKYGKKKSN